MKLRTYTASGYLLLLVTGCTVGPSYQKPDLAARLPAHYQQIENSETPKNLVTKVVSKTDRWWTSFNDDAINQLVDIALSHNGDLASADANIRRARTHLKVVDSSFLPQFSSQGRIGRDRFSKNSELLANIPIPNPKVDFVDYRAGFDASWELDLFGHSARLAEAANARITSVEQEREEVALRVAAEVVRNIIDYRAWQLRSKNASANLENTQQLLNLIILQQKEGLISESEVAQATTAVHQAAAIIPSLQSAALAALMGLTVLTDQSSEEVTAFLQADTDIPSVPNYLDFLGFPSDLLLRRPDLRVAERELAAATADIGVAIAEQYPRLTLVGNSGLDSITPGKFTDLASSYWNLGPQLSIPLFTGGRLAAQVKSREASRDAALARYRQAVLVAFADTETALIHYQREQRRLTQINHALAAQQHLLHLAEKRYQAGDTNFTDVLYTRGQLAQTREQQLASEQALAKNLTALFKSLGGGMKT
ncbi:MAG: efflux system, outer rane lipoprotein CmeC [Solimicrobium sp.]|nr:efflux system, outer rane lipoprotein CmeC [Solimicrobium sp.]